MKTANVRRQVSPDGAVQTLVLDGPPANIIGIETCHQLLSGLEISLGDQRTRLLVISGEGQHFSFGASVEEHLPGSAGEMLRSLHECVRGLSALPIPTVAAVRGRCLGGGFELALACGMVWAEVDAVFAAPEIRLGVFAPAATALLDGRLPRAIQEELLLTGRELPAVEALRWGLVARTVPPGSLGEAIDSFATESLRPRSPLGLRAATKAIRSRSARLLGRRLAALERLYTRDLLADDQGSEGIRAFLEKREPRWEGRA